MNTGVRGRSFSITINVSNNLPPCFVNDMAAPPVLQGSHYLGPAPQCKPSSRGLSRMPSRPRDKSPTISSFSSEKYASTCIEENECRRVMIESCLVCGSTNETAHCQRLMRVSWRRTHQQLAASAMQQPAAAAVAAVTVMSRFQSSPCR